MSLRPLYRWKSFWLGILVIGFLGFAWCDSFRCHAEVADGAWVLWSRTGGVMMVGYAEAVQKDFMVKYEPIPPDWIEEWSAFQPLFWEPRSVPDDVFVSDSDDLWVERVQAARNAHELYPAWMEIWPESRWMMFVPYWLILFAFLIPWSAFLAWRVRMQLNPSS